MFIRWTQSSVGRIDWFPLTEIRRNSYGTSYLHKQNGGKMNEPIRRPEQGSPRSSPRGSRSPAYPRTDSSGTLKTTISLGRVPSVIHSGPFYLVKDIGPARTLLNC